MIPLLAKIPEKIWSLLAIFGGISLVILSGSVGLVVIRASNLSYSNGKTNINIDAKKVKAASNNTEYTVNVLEEKIKTLNQKIEQFEGSNNPEVREVVESVREIEPVVQELERNNEQLIQAVEKAVD